MSNHQRHQRRRDAVRNIDCGTALTVNVVSLAERALSHARTHCAPTAGVLVLDQQYAAVKLSVTTSSM